MNQEQLLQFIKQNKKNAHKKNEKNMIDKQSFYCEYPCLNLQSSNMKCPHIRILIV